MGNRMLHMTSCTESGSTGKRFDRITLEHLLRPEHQSRIGSGQWFFCPDPDCAVAYFDAEGNSLDTSALCVRVGAKDKTPPRPLCYCFGHTFEEVQEEVAATGTSTIPDRIAEKCRQGLHDCERKNPQGSCCLGNVRAAMKEAQGASSCSTAESEEDCCVSPAIEGQSLGRRSVGQLAAGGAVVAAVLSSACCWLPFLLLAFGASAAGVSGFFERYRPLFLGVSAVLLSVGFFLVYVRKPVCGPGETCSQPNPRLIRFNKAMLWFATVFAVTFALFPNYVGALLGANQTASNLSPGAIATDAPYDLEFAVEGMTCEGCAVNLGSKLSGMPGVSSAEVLYPSGQARLRFESPESRPAIDAIVKAARDSGYEVILP